MVKSRTGDCVICTSIESPLGALVAGAATLGLCLLDAFSEADIPSTRRGSPGFGPS